MSIRAVDRPITETEIDKLHSQVFRDLEGDVCDLERMGQIAHDLIGQCSTGEDGYRKPELSFFAVMHLAKMLRDFKDRYERRWHGELTGGVMKRRRRLRTRNGQRLATHAKRLRR